MERRARARCHMHIGDTELHIFRQHHSAASSCGYHIAWEARWNLATSFILTAMGWNISLHTPSSEPTAHERFEPPQNSVPIPPVRQSRMTSWPTDGPNKKSFGGCLVHPIREEIPASSKTQMPCRTEFERPYAEVVCRAFLSLP